MEEVGLETLIAVHLAGRIHFKNTNVLAVFLTPHVSLTSQMIPVPTVPSCFRSVSVLHYYFTLVFQVASSL
jgi:hypothetical protein